MIMTTTPPTNQLIIDKPDNPKYDPVPRSGRATKRTPENARIICECVARGMPYVHACAVAGMSIETLMHWRAEDEAFQRQIAQAVADGVNARLRKIEAASADDWRAASWLLEHCQPEHFAKSRIQVEAVGQFDHAFVIPQETLNQIAEARKLYEREQEPKQLAPKGD